MVEKPLLKQFGDLTPDDFAKSPVWASVDSMDCDEPWFDGTDEETFRPWTGPLPVSPKDGMFLIRCKWTLADGRVCDGFCTPQNEEDEFSLGIIQPYLFLPSGQFETFWDGMFNRSEEGPQSLYNVLGDPKSIFPIPFFTTEGLATGITAGQIFGFYWRPEDEVKIYT